ncbi:MAG: YlxR family protein [Deltaproteobacteria bacterium]|nr:YlxR family protein [Deltaproteobacteria bacterium]
MSRNRGHIPIRTCICCGAKRNKRELIRLVLDTNGVVVRDNRGNKVGRGAYICGNEDCLAELNTGKGLSRAFKRNVSIPVF